MIVLYCILTYLFVVLLFFRILGLGDKYYLLFRKEKGKLPRKDDLFYNEYKIKDPWSFFAFIPVINIMLIGITSGMIIVYYIKWKFTKRKNTTLKIFGIESSILWRIWIGK